MSKAEKLAQRLNESLHGGAYIREAAAHLRKQDEAIKLAHEVLDADESKIIRNAKDGYPEGRAARELTLAERVKALCIYAADWKRWCLEREAQQERKDEAIKLALEALESCVSYGAMTGDEWVSEKAHSAIKLLREVQG